VAAWQRQAGFDLLVFGPGAFSLESPLWAVPETEPVDYVPELWFLDLGSPESQPSAARSAASGLAKTRKKC